jgi:hypothetical protein
MLFLPTKRSSRRAAFTKSSAVEAVWRVLAMASETVVAMSSMLRPTCSVALRCCWVTRAMSRAERDVSSESAMPSCPAWTAKCDADRMSAISRRIPATDSITLSARRRISAATRVKPRPASPALVPSSSALSASRSVRSATCVMTASISATRSAWLFSSLIRCATSRFPFTVRSALAGDRASLSRPPPLHQAAVDGAGSNTNATGHSR